MKVYYAHPVSLYNTKVDERDEETLKRLGFDVINPKSPDWSEQYKKRGMEFFIEQVRQCDAIAFRAFLDGSIGAGVRAEIDEAVKLGIPIIELPCCIQRRTLTVEQTREALRDCGQR